VAERPSRSRLYGNGVRAMLNNLSEQVRECHQHAELCAWRASVQTESQLKDIYLEMGQHWLMLARSHEFTERLEDFSNETKRRAD
jgi:hypothetical protein